MAGLLYGLEEGVYYSVYNMIESDEISNEDRAGFTGSFTAVQAVLSIVFPVVFGSLMYANGFIKSLAVVLAIVLIRIILSLYLKPKYIPKGRKTNIKEYLKLTKGSFIFGQLYRTEFLYGLIYTEGAFGYIVTIYIIKVFSDSFSLGIFTSVFSFITCVIGILFARFMDKKHYEPTIRISIIMTVIALCIMICDCRALTIILFNLFYTISKSIVILINENIQANLSNNAGIRNEYKVEYWLANETCFFAARIVSNGIFILMAVWNINVIMAVFMIFLLLLSHELSKLHRMMKS
ncbi:MAG: MFS transporter [Lachnospiraceae bacterium]|nr:MFS transporter [Lachnospiraceae bacterium]